MHGKLQPVGNVQQKQFEPTIAIENGDGIGDLPF